MTRCAASVRVPGTHSATRPCTREATSGGHCRQHATLDERCEAAATRRLAERDRMAAERREHPGDSLLAAIVEALSFRLAGEIDDDTLARVPLDWYERAHAWATAQRDAEEAKARRLANEGSK